MNWWNLREIISDVWGLSVGRILLRLWIQQTHLHQIWCLYVINTNDLAKRIQDYEAKIFSVADVVRQ